MYHVPFVLFPHQCILEPSCWRVLFYPENIYRVSIADAASRNTNETGKTLTLVNCWISEAILRLPTSETRSILYLESVRLVHARPERYISAGS